MNCDLYYGRTNTAHHDLSSPCAMCVRVRHLSNCFLQACARLHGRNSFFEYSAVYRGPMDTLAPKILGHFSTVQVRVLNKVNTHSTHSTHSTHNIKSLNMLLDLRPFNRYSCFRWNNGCTKVRQCDDGTDQLETVFSTSLGSKVRQSPIKITDINSRPVSCLFSVIFFLLFNL